MHQDKSNKIPNEYILSSIYTLKIDFKFPSAKVEKLKVDKQKGTEGIYYSLLFFLEILRKLYMSSSSYPIHPVYIEKLCSGSGERRKTTTYTYRGDCGQRVVPQLKKGLQTIMEHFSQIHFYKLTIKVIIYHVRVITYSFKIIIFIVLK